MPNVLVVDDEKDICLLLTGILDKEGFGTTYALTLEEAKVKLSLEKFEAAFIDINLPDGMGFKLIPIIKEKNTGSKVIIISAYDIGLGIASGQGADYLIKKPFSRSIVLTALEELQLNH